MFRNLAIAAVLTVAVLLGGHAYSENTADAATIQQPIATVHVQMPAHTTGYFHMDKYQQWWGYNWCNYYLTTPSGAQTYQYSTYCW